MSFDPVDSLTVAETQNSFLGYAQDIGETAQVEDAHQALDTVEDVMDYKYATNDPSVQDFAEAGAEKRSDQNILAQFYDGTGAIVNQFV